MYLAIAVFRVYERIIETEEDRSDRFGTYRRGKIERLSRTVNTLKVIVAFLERIYLFIYLFI